mgnify:CR=1 FL=1
MSVLDLTAVELGKKIKAKEITVVDAVKASLEQIKKLEPVVHAYVTVDEEGALKRAEEVQKLIDDGTLTGPLAGVPVAIKDNMCTKNLLTTCSSKILYNFVPTFSAEAVINLEKAGTVILGKTSLPWEAPQRLPLTASPETHGTRNTYRAVLPVVPVRQWQRKNASLR